MSKYCIYCHEKIYFWQSSDKVVEGGKKSNSYDLFETILGSVHSKCWMLEKKYGKGYFIIKDFRDQYDGKVPDTQLERLYYCIMNNKGAFDIQELISDFKIDKNLGIAFYKYLIEIGHVYSVPNSQKPTLPKSD